MLILSQDRTILIDIDKPFITIIYGDLKQNTVDKNNSNSVQYEDYTLMHRYEEKIGVKLGTYKEISKAQQVLETLYNLYINNEKSYIIPLD